MSVALGLPAAHNTERIGWIKKLRKGNGLLRRNDNVPLDLFNVSTFEEIREVVREVYTLSPNVAEVKAIAIALGIGPRLHNTNLSDRRKYSTAMLGVSSRTVIRLEEVGAFILDSYFEMLGNPGGELRRQVADMRIAAERLESLASGEGLSPSRIDDSSLSTFV